MTKTELRILMLAVTVAGGSSSLVRANPPSATLLFCPFNVTELSSLMWTDFSIAPHAHLVLQARVKFANGEMAEAFINWYPNFSASDDYAAKELLAA